MAERTLSTRELNRALLARQLLLRRSRAPLTRALEHVGGLQTQYAPSAYIGLWSRLEGFAFANLTRALEGRRAVQGTLMRSTIHVVSAADYPLLSAGLREARREWWTAVHRRRAGDVDMAAVADRVRLALDGGARRRDDLLAAVHELHPGSGTMVWNGVHAWLDLVRVPPSGTWERRRADLFAAADDWLGPTDATGDDGCEHLLRRYLRAFGPARLADAASWAGLKPQALRPAAERLELRRFRDEEGKELLDLPRAPLPPADTHAPVRLLPTWDATLLVHARRTQILPEEYRPLVFDVKTPHSVPTFLVDGSVAGTWRVERNAARATLTLAPYAPLPAAARRELQAEAEALVRLHEPDATSHRVATRRGGPA